MIVTIFKDLFETAAGFDREVSFILERIRTGKSKQLVEQIRSSDKPTRDKLKKKLPSICFSGTFSNRSLQGLKEHSGLICLDFDKFNTTDELIEFKEYLIKDKFTYSCFISPSGDGLKVLVKIPKDKDNHLNYWEALRDYYNNDHFDLQTQDIPRVCFESYDPDIYINDNSETWDKLSVKEVEIKSDENVILQLKSSNQIIQKLLTWFNKNYTLSEGQRNSNLFKLAIAFNDFGIDKHETEATFRQFATSDFTEKEINSVIKSAYKNKANFGTKYFDDKYTKEKIERKIRAGESIKNIAQSFNNYTEQEIEEAVEGIKQSLAITEFWTYDDNNRIKLQPNRYKEYLEQSGFCKLFPNGNDNYVFVKVKENLIEDTNATLIKDFVLSNLYSGNYSIAPYNLMANTTKYFKDDYLSLLKSGTINFKEDKTDTCYLYFRNYCLEVTATSVTKIDYIDLDGYIWKKHIIDRDYQEVNINDSVFAKFVWLVSGKDETKFNSIRSVVGYLLHSHKTSANNKAIIFNDEVISENPNGGSGKGIICNAISHLKRTSFIDGKQFEFGKSFAYQTVSADTQVLIFDDVKKNFGFENLFSLITEGITLEKKNKDAIKIPISKSPKVVITTNYTIGGVGGSFERRKFEIELSSYFGSHHSPLDEFGHMFFEDWSEMEWARFDNFMISCVQYYLKNGLVKHQFNNLEVRKFIKETSFEFHEWSNDGNIELDTLLYKNELFAKFTDDYQDFKKFLTQKKFSNWLDTYAKYNKLEKLSGRTHNQRWIKFSKTKITNEQDQSSF